MDGTGAPTHTRRHPPLYHNLCGCYTGDGQLPTTNASKFTMIREFLTLFLRFRNRQVLGELIRRDLRSRYKVSVLGFFWSLLRPALSMLVIAVVFGYLVRLPLTLGLYGEVGYFAFLVFGYLPWVYFSGALAEGAQAILANAHLVKKVYCPRAIFPLTTVGAQLVNFGLAMAVFLPLIWIFTSARPSWAILALPFIALLQTLLVSGLVMGLSALNVLYRDVGQILEFVTLSWFYLTPVLYPVNMPIETIAAFGIPAGCIWLNPMATLSFWYRWSCLGTIDLNSAAAAPLTASLLEGTVITVVICIGTCLLGYYILRKLDIQVVDEL